jgi:hypothetical protein
MTTVDRKPADTQGDGPAPTSADPAVRLRQMLSAYQVSQAIHAAAVLGVADKLADGPEDCEKLAALTGTHPDALCRLLRGLAGVGFFTETAPRCFALTPLAALLRSDTPDSQHALAVMLGQDWLWRPWGRLAESVRTGSSVFESEFGMPFFAYLQRQPEARAVFQKALAGATTRAAVAENYDFSGAGTVADIGGGQGALLADILTKFPQPRGILFERPAVLAAARDPLATAGVLDRCDLIEGDFFESVCGGADTYVVSQVLHDWNDEAAQAILANCRRAMAADGRLLVVERVVPEGGPRPPGPLTDLNMLVLMGGKERTAGEYRELLANAGFRTTRILEMGEAWSLIEAVPDA